MRSGAFARSGNRLLGALVFFFASVGMLAAPRVAAGSESIPDGVRVPGAVVPAIPTHAANEKQRLKLDHSLASVPLRIVLPPPSAAENDRAAQPSGKRALIVGFHREVPIEYQGDVAPRLEWTSLPGGAFTSALSVTSPGTVSMRVGLRAELAPGGEIRFFGEDPDERFPVATGEDFHQEGDEVPLLWSPTVPGDTIGIEIFLPSEKARGAFSLRIDPVAHAPTTTRRTTFAPSLRALECPDIHVDVACRRGSYLDRQQYAVARIRVESEGASVLCTGTLLNDTDADTVVPYLLTTNHCIPDQSVASTLEAHWFLQRDRCEGTELDSRNTTTIGGSDLLTASVEYDQTLLRLRNVPPAGAVLAGWSADRPLLSSESFVVHHPDGGAKGFAAGEIVAIVPRAPTSSEELTNAISVQYYDGTTEPGSSGAGLFLANGGYLVGALSSGDACGRGSTDLYGPFRDFFPQAARWLNPTPPPPTSPPPQPPPPQPPPPQPPPPQPPPPQPPPPQPPPPQPPPPQPPPPQPPPPQPPPPQPPPPQPPPPQPPPPQPPPPQPPPPQPPPPQPPDDDHADDPAQATVVAVHSSTAGTLERSGDLDYFRVNLPTLGTLRIYTTGTTDTYGTLINRPRDTRREADDAGEGDNFLIIEDQAPAGTWYVEVRGFVSSVTGVYTLHVESSEPLEAPGHVIPLVLDASDHQIQGIVRITNLSDRAGGVDIHAVDDSGRRFNPITLSLEARASAQIHARDLEQGNPARGLSGVVGDGIGHWRLELRTDLDIEARGYVRAANGTLANVQEVAAETQDGSMRYHVPFFNPAGNARYVSWLRLVNPRPEPATVTVAGTDDAGNPAPEGEVELTVPAGEARTLSATQLEEGDDQVQGRLGDGEGKWQLQVGADRPLLVMSLVRDEFGSITNLSR